MVTVPRRQHVYPTLFQIYLFTVVSMQMRYSSLHTDLPKLVGSHKKAPSPYIQVLVICFASIFFWVGNWQVTIFRWCRRILNVYKCWSYQQSSNINRFLGSSWNDTHNYVPYIHYKGFSKGYQPFTEYVAWKGTITSLFSSTCCRYCTFWEWVCSWPLTY